MMPLLMLQHAKGLAENKVPHSAEAKPIEQIGDV